MKIYFLEKENLGAINYTEMGTSKCIGPNLLKKNVHLKFIIGRTRNNL